MKQFDFKLLSIIALGTLGANVIGNVTNYVTKKYFFHISIVPQSVYDQIAYAFLAKAIVALIGLAFALVLFVKSKYKQTIAVCIVTIILHLFIHERLIIRILNALGIEHG